MNRLRRFALSITVLTVGISMLTSSISSSLLIGQAASLVQVALVDDGDAGFVADEGKWSNTPFAQGLSGDVTMFQPSAGAKQGRVRWVFTVTPGEYDIQITYPAFNFLNKKAEYEVLDDRKAVAKGTIDMTQAPKDEEALGKGWKKLGTFSVKGTRLELTLHSKRAPGYTIADAVRLMQKAAQPLNSLCGDNSDNDRDGKIDFPNDPECSSRDDQTEAALRCPDNSPTISIAGNDADGVRFTNMSQSGLYRLEMFSPEGLTDAEYASYAWTNLPSDAQARYHGSSVLYIKNAAPVFTNGRVSNAAGYIDSSAYDPVYNENKKRAANAARGVAKSINLNNGDTLDFIVNETQNAFADNKGSVAIRVCNVTPNLRVKKTGASAIARGEKIQFGIEVSNDGSDTISNVVVRDMMVAGGSFDLASLPQNCTRIGDVGLFCTIDSIPARESRWVTVMVVANGNCNEKVVNDVAITSPIDPNLNGNESRWETLIVCQNSSSSQASSVRPPVNSQASSFLSSPSSASSASSAIPISFCGNGITETDEECDDANTNANDACSNTCQRVHCGDTITQPQEQCDDGNRRPGDGCSASCTRESCGDGVVSVGEFCDNGTDNGKPFGDGTAGCSQTCRVDYCGDKTKQEYLGEQCDDGNVNSDDGCTASCKIPACNDGLDNDNDGKADVLDPHCYSRNDETEHSDVFSASTSSSSISSIASSAQSSVVSNAVLNISIKNTATVNTAMKNEKNINLLRFEAKAGEAEDVLLKKLVFSAQTGSLLNGQNYTLWVDTDKDGSVDTILQKAVSTAAKQVRFNALAGSGYILAKNEPTIFEVHTDIAASLTTNNLQLKFDTLSEYVDAREADNGSFLIGIRTNGVCQFAPCEINVTTGASTLWSLMNQGNLFVSQDATPIRSHQLLGGTLSETILRVQFRSELEDIEVTDLQITSMGNSATSIERLELYKEGETTAFATATIGGCGTAQVPLTHNGKAVQTFCADMENRQFVITKGTEVDILVRPRMKADEQGAVSGQDIQFFLSGTPVSDNATGRGAIRARGSASFSNLVANNGNAVAEGEVFIGTSTPKANTDIVGNRHEVALSRITTIMNANPDADGTAIPTGVSPIGQFKFTAAINANSLNGINKATLTGVIFNVVATNVKLGTGDQSALSTSDFFFYNKADSTAKSKCTASVIAASGSFLVFCSNLDDSSVDMALNAGQSATFVLEADVQTPKISASAPSTLQVSLQDFSDIAKTTFARTSSHLVWADQDTAKTSFTWIDYPETTVTSTKYEG